MSTRRSSRVQNATAKSTSKFQYLSPLEFDQLYKFKAIVPLEKCDFEVTDSKTNVKLEEINLMSRKKPVKPDPGHDMGDSRRQPSQITPQKEDSTLDEFKVPVYQVKSQVSKTGELSALEVNRKEMLVSPRDPEKREEWEYFDQDRSNNRYTLRQRRRVPKRVFENRVDEMEPDPPPKPPKGPKTSPNGSTSKEWTCDICYSQFSTSASLNAHRKAFHNIHIQCQVSECGQFFGGPRDLTDHWWKAHWGGGPTTCNLCTRRKNFGSRAYLRLHVRRTHPYALETLYEAVPKRAVSTPQPSSNTNQSVVPTRRERRPSGTPTCPVDDCGLKFTAESMRYHLETDHPSYTIKHTCSYCPRIFSCNTHKLIHIRMRHSSDPNVPFKFKCFCGIGFNVKHYYDKHQVKAHGISERSSPTKRLARVPANSYGKLTTSRITSNSYQKHCPSCNMTFSSCLEFEFHKKEDHSTGFRCPTCPKTLENFVGLKLHLNSCGRSGLERGEIKYTRDFTKPATLRGLLAASKPDELFEKDERAPSKKQSKEMYFCEFCPYSNRNLNHYTIHMNTHTKEIEYPCSEPDCDKIYYHPNSLKSHLETMHGRNKWVSTTSRSNLKSKARKSKFGGFKAKKNGVVSIPRTEKGLFRCSQCPRLLKTHLQLKLHETTHFRADKYGAPDSSSGWRPLSSLMNAPKANTPINKGRKTSTELENGDLEQDSSLQELDEENYKCPKCSMMFKSVTSLKQHFNIHTLASNYPCGVCGAEFSRASALSEHKKTKHSTAPIQAVFKIPMRSPSPDLLNNPLQFVEKSILKNFLKKSPDPKTPKTFTPPSQRTLKTCTICYETYYHSVSQHMLLHHSANAHPCSRCWRSFTSILARDQHIECYHKKKAGAAVEGGILRNLIEGQAPSQMEDNTTPEELESSLDEVDHRHLFRDPAFMGIFRCDKCPKVFSSVNYLNTHVETVHAKGLEVPGDEADLNGSSDVHLGEVHISDDVGESVYIKQERLDEEDEVEIVKEVIPEPQPSEPSTNIKSKLLASMGNTSETMRILKESCLACRLCPGNVLVVKSMVQQHMQDVHSSVTLFKCGIGGCCLAFPRKEEMLSHWRDGHRINKVKIVKLNKGNCNNVVIR